MIMAPQQAPSTLAARVRALKQEATEKRESQESTLDEVTRVFEFGVDEFDHIEWMLKHGLIDREGALDVAAKVGRPRQFMTSPTTSPSPTIYTSNASQAPDAGHANAMPISWSETTSSRPQPLVTTADQATSMDAPPAALAPSAPPAPQADSIVSQAIQMARDGRVPPTTSDFAAAVAAGMGGRNTTAPDPRMQSPPPRTQSIHQSPSDATTHDISTPPAGGGLPLGGATASRT